MTTIRQIVLGLDFGGTKLAAGLIDLKSATLLDAAHMPTPANQGAAHVADEMIRLSRKLVGKAVLAGIGVSFGGHVRGGDILRSLHVPGWEHYPLRQQLSTAFAIEYVAIANDANATALGEWLFGAGKGAQSLLYATVSTGIGGGVVINGQIVEGAKGMAGEIGHVKMDPDGPPCTCGSRGCLEAMAAGPAIVRDAGVFLKQQPNVQSALRGKSDLTAKDIAQAALKGDVIAVQVMERAGRTLGRAIANALILLDVERIVIGGGISRAGHIWWEAVTGAVDEAVLSWNRPVDVRLSGLGEYEGVWGAAALLAEQLSQMHNAQMGLS